MKPQKKKKKKKKKKKNFHHNNNNKKIKSFKKVLDWRLIVEFQNYTYLPGHY